MSAVPVFGLVLGLVIEASFQSVMPVLPPVVPAGPIRGRDAARASATAGHLPPWQAGCALPLESEIRVSQIRLVDAAAFGGRAPTNRNAPGQMAGAQVDPLL